MSSERRSSRLNNVSKEPMAAPPTSTRSADTWRQRHALQEDESSSDESTHYSFIVENNENSDLLNKMDEDKGPNKIENIKISKGKRQQQNSQVKRQSRNVVINLRLPLTAGEQSSIRTALEQNERITSDESDTPVTPPKQLKRAAPQHVKSPSRLLGKFSINESEEEQLQDDVKSKPRKSSKQGKLLVKIAKQHEDGNATERVLATTRSKKKVPEQQVLSTTRLLDGLSNDNPKEQLAETGKVKPTKSRKAAKPTETVDEMAKEDNAAKHVLPTKQRKTQLPDQQLISPTRLLDRLSIDESKEAELEGAAAMLSSEPMSTRNKYQKARRVLNSAETKNLPGREQQLKDLREFFTHHLDTNTSGSLYVSGQPGTGKTACLSLLQKDPEYAKRMMSVYINCTSIPSVGAVYKKLCAELQLKPANRTDQAHLKVIQQHLRTSKRMLLLVLDEVDQLCTARQSVLYTIFEWPVLPGARILLVGIANSLDLTDRLLMRLNSRCELKPKLMHFPAYTKQQIVEIFKARLVEADVLDVFPPVTLQLLAAKVSAVSGDLRRALDIGRRVVEIAEQQKRDGEREFNMKAFDLSNEAINKDKPTEDTLKPVQITQVAAVMKEIYGASQNLEEDIEVAFPLQQKLMLCSLVLMLRNERNKDITIGRLHEVYRRVCNKRNILALDQAEFTGTVDLVETRGILRIIRKKEPRLNKVVLQWDEEEVHAALSDKQLIASILNDTACLGK